MGGSGVLFVEHFLTKSAFRVGTPSALLASILSRVSWSVSMTWKVSSYEGWGLWMWCNGPVLL